MSLVVVYHLGDVFLLHVPFVAVRVVRHAVHVMPLFFVMSGFALTYVYGESMRASSLSPRAFWLSRAFRLWPIYLVAILLRFFDDCVLAGGVPAPNAAAVLAQALFVQNWVPSLVWYGNAPGWTVSVEAFLYLLFPWLVPWLLRSTTSRAVLVAGAAWAVGLVPAIVYCLSYPEGIPPPSGAPILAAVRFLPPLHLPSFIIGITAAKVLLADREAGLRRPGGLISAVALAPVVFCLLGGLEHVRPSRFLRWPFPLAHDGLLAPAWGLLLVGLSHPSALARFLSRAPLGRLGVASYGLYILHFPLYDAFVCLVPTWTEKAFFFPLFYVMLLPLVVVSFERFEQPVRDALLRRFGEAR